MKVQCKSSVLSRGMKIIGQVVDRAPFNPMMANVKMDVVDGKLRLMGRRHDHGIIAYIEPENVLRPGELVMNAHTLKQITEAYWEDEPFLIANENMQATICFPYGSYQVPSAEPEKYPEVQMEMQSDVRLELAATDLIEMIESVSSVCKLASTKTWMWEGVLFCVEPDSLRLLTTDRKMLNTIIKPAHILLREGQANQFIVSLDFCRVMQSICKDMSDERPVMLEFNERQVCFKNDSYAMIGNLMQSKTPPWRMLFDQPRPKEMTINRDETISAIMQIKPFSEQSDGFVQMHYAPDQVLLKHQDDCEVILPSASTTASGHVGLTLQYLHEALHGARGVENLTVRLGERNNVAVEFDAGNGYTAFVMPLVDEDS